MNEGYKIKFLTLFALFFSFLPFAQATTLGGQFDDSVTGLTHGTTFFLLGNTMDTGLSGDVHGFRLHVDPAVTSWYPSIDFNLFECTDSGYQTCSNVQSYGYFKDNPSSGVWDFTGNGTHYVLDSSKYYRFALDAVDSGFSDIRPYIQGSNAGSQGCYGVNPGTAVMVTSYPCSLKNIYYEYFDSTGATGPTFIPVTGSISTSTEWLGGRVYKISGDLTVDFGATLTLDPGVIIKFDTATTSSGIIVNGTLIANGDQGNNNPVFFTSSKDDLVGGDTNKDEASTTSAAGDWNGITINSGGTATFSYSTVRYGGSAGSSDAMVYNNGGSLTIDSDSTIAYGNDYGIRNSAGTTTITNSDIGYNDYGLYIDGGTASINASSTIHNDNSYGIYNNTTSTTSATGNYWGDSSGPTYPGNPGGIGDVISNYVAYNPFIGTSTLHYVIEQTHPNCALFDSCWSVDSNRDLLLSVDATTTALYSSELDAATSTWNALGRVSLELATSTSDLDITTVYLSDVNWKGGTTNGIPGSLELNSYYLNSNTNSQIQNTITHELGHVLGLDHSYTGNVMYFAQSSQDTLGPQDVSDFNYLWP